MDPLNTRFYEFGPFRLDAAEHIVLRDGQIIPLTPKVFETLLVLVENSGHVVDKDELLQKVWSDTFVEETNLTKNISILRKILSDGDAGKSFIETIPKRGYRFVAEVTKSDHEEEREQSLAKPSDSNVIKDLPAALPKSRKTDSGTHVIVNLADWRKLEEHTEPKPEPSPAALNEVDAEQLRVQPTNAFESTAETSGINARWHKRWPVIAAIAVLLMATVGVGLYWFRSDVVAGIGFGLYKFAFQKKTGISLASAQITRLTSSGTVCEGEISPDGKWLVYVEQEGDHHSLWLKQVAVPESATKIVAPIAGSCGGVAISPDGNYVYYTVIEPGRLEASLYQVPILGGTTRKLFTGIIGPVTFSPDGKRIAYLHWINDEDRLMVANADGSGQRQLAARSGNECFVNANNGPAWSPDGKTLLTSIGTFTPQLSMTVAAVSPEDGAITVFSQHKFQQILDVAWLSDGQAVLVTANDQFGSGSSNKIWQISYPSGEAHRITNDLNGYLTLSLTADSNALVTVQQQTLGNLWIASMDDPAYTQITTGTSVASYPSWTPDGKVVYTSNSNGNSDLYLLDPSDGVSKRLTSDSDNNRDPVVSPDGRYVVFNSDRSGILCLWRIDIDGSNAKQLNNQTSLNPSFAPDGRTIVYTSLANKYISSTIGIDGGEPHQLSEEQSFAPVFSPDGTQIACLYPGGADSPFRISIAPATGGLSLKSISTPKGTARQLRWTPDGKAFLYPVSHRGVTNLWMQTIEGGEPKQITNFTSDLILSFDVSRDGKQLVLSRGTTSSDVVLFSGIKD
jgi:Tol biopolymer transport system component/DNA-binding winged helix-turn-helix (wHTH) protein